MKTIKKLLQLDQIKI